MNKVNDTWYRGKILQRTSKGKDSKNAHYNIDKEYGGKAGLLINDFDWEIVSDPGKADLKAYNPGPSVHSKIDYDGKQTEKAQAIEQEI